MRYLPRGAGILGGRSCTKMHQRASVTPRLASSKVSDVVKVHNLLGEPIDEDEETLPLNATNLD